MKKLLNPQRNGDYACAICELDYKRSFRCSLQVHLLIGNSDNKPTNRTITFATQYRPHKRTTIELWKPINID